MKNNYRKVLDWFRSVLKTEIDSAVYFFDSDIEGMKDEKRKKFKKSAYSKSQYDALEWCVALSDSNQKKLKVLLQFYTSSSYTYFFRRLEEGENIEIGERIKFDLVAVNENTKQRTKLISSDEKDDIDNDFQGWILDNCSGFPNLNPK